jgi:hypothetical protein
MDKAPAPTFVGIDVAKHRLEVRLRPSGEGFALDYDDENVAALVGRCCCPLNPGQALWG